MSANRARMAARASIELAGDRAAASRRGVPAGVLNLGGQLLDLASVGEQVAGGEEVGEFADSGGSVGLETVGAGSDLRARRADEWKVVVKRVGHLADGLVVGGQVGPGSCSRRHDVSVAR